MSETNEMFRYDKMVEDALRSVVQQALLEVVGDGLIDDHHFYITFRTDTNDVEIPDYLRERYPGEMTIVLQHQFYDLEANDDFFSVMLSFNNVPERLKIPYKFITIFADPSVNFALQFQPLEAEEEFENYIESEFEDELDDKKADSKGGTGQVVSLDSFRKEKQNDDEEK